MLEEVNAALLELAPIQERIAKSESESVIDRWEFGRLLVARRGDKKQLPNGLRADLADRLGLEASEITRRMQLAEKFSSESEVVDACKKHGGAWRRIIREELVKHRTQAKVSPWADRAKSRVDRLLSEAGRDDQLHDELVALLRAALKTLTDGEAA